jgi:hypothetical protein
MHVAHMREIIKFYSENLKRSLGRLCRREEGKMDFYEIGCKDVGSIHMTQDTIQWRFHERRGIF